MTGITIAGAGSIIIDILYANDKSSRKKYYVGYSGGGAQWNVLANASVNGATTIAACVAGSDRFSREAISDLTETGVKIVYKDFPLKRRTRALHEILNLESIKFRVTDHSFEVRCPVCRSETYRSNAAIFKMSNVEPTKYQLMKGIENGLILHLDGLDKARLKLAKEMKEIGAVLSLDLGGSTGLLRMRQTSILEKLALFELIFINSKAVPELLRMVGASTEKDILKTLPSNLIVITDGEKGARLYSKSGDNIIEIVQSAVKQPKIVDTAGAGDALIGSFLSSFSKIEVSKFKELFGDRKKLDEILSTSQKWASYKCGFAGARGHMGTGERNGVKIGTMNAKDLSVTSEVEELKSINLGKLRCYACQSPLSVRDERELIDASAYQINVLRLPTKVQKSWESRNDSKWNSLQKLSGPGYVVGTGGSYVVANFVAQTIGSNLKIPVIPIRPFDYIRTAVPTRWVIFISESGNTSDIIGAMNYAIELGVESNLVITGHQNSSLVNMIRYGKDEALVTNSNGERGFLSVAGVIVPSFLVLSVFTNEIWRNEQGYIIFNKLFDRARGKVSELFSSIEHILPERVEGNAVSILGGGYAWSCMLNIESKMMESGKGSPEISEIKDHSHGRFVSSTGKDTIVIICGLPDDLPYRAFLKERLHRKSIVIELETEFEGPEGGMELLLQSEHLMRLISEREKVDLSKPKIPKKGLELYRYEDLRGYKTQ